MNTYRICYQNFVWLDITGPNVYDAVIEHFEKHHTICDCDGGWDETFNVVVIDGNKKDYLNVYHEAYWTYNDEGDGYLVNYFYCSESKVPHSYPADRDWLIV